MASGRKRKIRLKRTKRAHRKRLAKKRAKIRKY